MDGLTNYNYEYVPVYLSFWLNLQLSPNVCQQASLLLGLKIITVFAVDLMVPTEIEGLRNLTLTFCDTGGTSFNIHMMDCQSNLFLRQKERK